MGTETRFCFSSKQRRWWRTKLSLRVKETLQRSHFIDSTSMMAVLCVSLVCSIVPFADERFPPRYSLHTRKYYVSCNFVFLSQQLTNCFCLRLGILFICLRTERSCLARFDFILTNKRNHTSVVLWSMRRGRRRRRRRRRNMTCRPAGITLQLSIYHLDPASATRELLVPRVFGYFR